VRPAAIGPMRSP